MSELSQEQLQEAEALINGLELAEPEEWSEAAKYADWPSDLADPDYWKPMRLNNPFVDAQFNFRFDDESRTNGFHYWYVRAKKDKFGLFLLVREDVRPCTCEHHDDDDDDEEYVVSDVTVVTLGWVEPDKVAWLNEQQFLRFPAAPQSKERSEKLRAIEEELEYGVAGPHTMWAHLIAWLPANQLG